MAGIFLVASASATDLNETITLEIDSNVDSDVINVETIEDNQEDSIINESMESEVQNSADDSQVLTANYTPKDSNEIQSYIDSASDGDTIVLDGNYLFTSTVNVAKQLNFVGINDATVDGDNKVGLFSVSNRGVTFKDITFKNGKTTGSGGAVYFNKGGSCVNCSFINNYAGSYGGAVYGGSCVNCSFVKNNVNVEQIGGGGAISNTNAYNCIFIENSANLRGGAIYCDNSKSKIFIDNCSFIGNRAKHGGAIYVWGENENYIITNCSFEDNIANIAGAIFDGNAEDCTFIENFAYYYGNAMNEGSAVNCIFKNYKSSDLNNVNAINCIFESNDFPVTIADIKKCIEDANENDTIVLSGTYLINSSDSRIVVNKKLNFIGINDATFDGCYNYGLFSVKVKGVTFKGITFRNAKRYGYGGAIESDLRGSVICTVYLEDCIFINNTGTNGGAIAFGYANNCIFINNTAENGGAMYGYSPTNCIFINNTATKAGGAICYSSKTPIVNCSFVGNSAYGDRSYGDKSGGAVYSSSNASIVNCSFVGNSAYGYGSCGAIYFTGEGSVVNCSFVGNSAHGDYSGGAIYNGNVTNCSFDGNYVKGHSSGGVMYGGSCVNCIFINNSASGYYSSGVIYRASAKNCTFTDNSANDGCGVIFYGDALNCIFKNNHGEDSGVMNYGNAVNCTFESNSAYGFDTGGAMMGGSAVNCIFVGNVAYGFDSGGAMMGGSAVNCTFINNSVYDYKSGGAMYGGSAMNCTFISNSAYSRVSGGAIYDGNVVNCTFTENTAYLYGGAMKYGIAVNSTFENNSAGSSGGALSDVNAYNCIFIGNTAGYGGAISVDKDGYVIDNCSFIDNYAKYGGAIAKTITEQFGSEFPHQYDFTVKIYNSRFINNDARNRTVAEVEASDGLRDDNDEYNNGGAIYLDVCSADISDCLFEDNRANGYGGAIYLKQCSNVKIDDCQFKDCYSSHDGGAIYWQSGDGFNITYCTFENCGCGEGCYLSFNESTGEYLVSDCLFDQPPLGITYSEYYNPRFDVCDLSFYNGEDGILNVILFDVRGPMSGKTVTLTINDNNYSNVTDSEGFTSFNLKNYLNEVGNYTVFVSFAGEGLDNAVSKDVNVSVNRYDVALSVNDLSVFAGENGYLIADLSNIRGPLSEKTVTLTVNGRGYGKTTSGSGLAQFNIKDYLAAAGTYILTFSFAGDEFNNPVSTNASVLIYKHETVMQVENLSLFVGENGRLNGKLYDDRGPLVYKTITFHYNNNIISKRTSYNGEFTLDIGNDLKITALGKYNFTATFAGDEQNNPVSTIVNVSINKYDSVIAVNDVSIFNGDEGFLTVSLSNIRGALSGKDIILFIGENNYTLATDASGIARFDVNDYFSCSGNWTVEVSFKGDDMNNPVSANANVNILKHQSSLSANDLTVNVGEDGNLVAYLSDDRGALANKTLVFSINGTNHTFMADDGSVAINIKDYLFSAGDYVIGITFEGDEYEIGCYCQSNVRINNYEGILSVAQIGSYYNDTYLSVKLTNSKTGQNISHANVELAFSNYETAHLTTDENGEATYKIGFAPGSYGVSANVVDDFVDVGEARLNVAVQQITGQIAVTQLNNTALAVRLYNPVDSHVYRNIKVLLRFNNEPIVELTTSDNGVAIYTMSVAFGSYPIFVSVTSDYTSFDPIDTKIDITNITNGGGSGDTKKDSFIGFDPIVFEYGGVGKTTVHRDGCTISNETISVEGHDEAKINLVGDDIYVSGLDVGSYTLRITTIPDENYYAVNQTSSITVSNIPVTILASSSAVYYNSGNTWSVKLYHTKTKAPLSGMKVSIKVYTGTKLYKSFNLNTDSKGMVTLKVSTWAVGAYKVVVSFSKHGYAASPVNRVLTIKKTPVVITAPKLSVYLKTAKKWSIKVVDSKTKKAIASTKLTLKVYTGKKYNSYAVKTNSKGVATFATSGLAVGTHKVVVSFSKTGYMSKSVSSSIVVKPIPLTIKGDFSYGSGGSTVRVTVTNKLTGKPANGISVKLMVYTGSKLTKSYTLVTGNYKTYKGFVGFGTNAFSVGTHKVVIKPVSNMYSGQGTTSLVIKSGAANGGVYYSFVSKGKLTLA